MIVFAWCIDCKNGVKQPHKHIISEDERPTPRMAKRKGCPPEHQHEN